MIVLGLSILLFIFVLALYLILIDEEKLIKVLDFLEDPFRRFKK